MGKMSYPEMTAAVRQFFQSRGNPAMASSEVYQEAFAAQDKVRFQLVFSNMALKPPHDMVKLQVGTGTNGVRWRLRESSDPPFVAPVKVPRTKRTVELATPVAAPAPDIPQPAKPVEPAKPAKPFSASHRTIGNVAETPAHIRAQEPHDTLPVEHRALPPPPPNNLLAHAMQHAFERRKTTRPFAASVIHPAGKTRGEPVAAFAKQRELQYEVPPNVKVQELPRGVSSVASINKANITLPKFEMSATAEQHFEQTVADYLAKGPDQFPAQYTVEEHQGEKDQPAPVARHDAVLPEAEPTTPLPQEPAPHDAVHAAPAPVEAARPQAATAASLTPGQLLDMALGLVGPAIKAVLRDALIEAITSPQVKEVLHAQVPIQEAQPAPVHAAAVAAEVSATPAVDAKIAVPPYEEPPKSEGQRRVLMPADVEQMSKTRLPVVVVIGLPKPQWEWDIKDAFKKWLDIRTVHHTARGKTARDFCRNADHVLYMIDYNSHAMDDSLKAGNIAFEKIKGGPSAAHDRCKEIIKSYAQKGVAEMAAA